ncbi:MAG: hypothetical protein VW518_00130 [Burkholderiaceae bacterium]
MITLFSTLISFLAGGLPKILDFMQDRSDKAHELALAGMQTQRELELAKAGFDAQAKVEEIRTDQIAMQTHASMQNALLAHDQAIGKGASQWVVDLRASVRPVITYSMFLMLAFINIFGCYYAVATGTPFADALNLLWDDETQTLFASIIAFWFGTQAFGGRKG